jgi:hypothetical protein
MSTLKISAAVVIATASTLSAGVVGALPITAAQAGKPPGVVVRLQLRTQSSSKGVLEYRFEPRSR